MVAMARWARAVLVLAGAVLVSSCMLAPGRFVSTLDLRSDGTFAFTYVGEIAVLALAKPRAAGEGAFAPSPCHGAYDAATRPCTKAELAEQKKAWEQSRVGAEDNRRQQAEVVRGLFGGIDFDSPGAPEELARRLRQQKGWRSVEYRGKGVYQVDYAAQGTLSQDFSFPTIERFAMGNPFVQVIQRADGALRIDAPGFSTSGGLMMGAMMMGAANAKGEAASANLPAMDGTFTFTTDGVVLANNTEDGPRPAAGGKGQQMTWRISPANSAAPMALVRPAR